MEMIIIGIVTAIAALVVLFKMNIYIGSCGLRSSSTSCSAQP